MRSRGRSYADDACHVIISLFTSICCGDSDTNGLELSCSLLSGGRSTGMFTATSPLTPLSETPYKRSRITTADTTDPGPPTSRRRITSESAQRSLARSVRSRYERTSNAAPTRRSTRLRGGPSSLVRPLEEEGERTPRASLQRSGARYSTSRSHYKPRASLLQTQATPLTIERRAGVLCDVAKAVLLEYVRFADATEKHAQRRDMSWKKLQGECLALTASS